MMNFNSNKMHQILDIDQSFVIETPLMNLSFYNKHQYITIQPREDEWSYKLLSIFLNCLDKWIVDPENGCRKITKHDGSSYFFFKFNSSTEEWQELIYNISPQSITVKASIEWIDSELCLSITLQYATYILDKSIFWSIFQHH